MREHNEAVNRLDFISGRAPITVDYAPGTTEVVEQHDGSRLVLQEARRRLRRPRPRRRHELPAAARRQGEIVTGLLYVDREPEDLHQHLNTVDTPLNTLSEKELCPGSAALEKINASLR